MHFGLLGGRCFCRDGRYLWGAELLEGTKRKAYLSVEP